MERIKSQFKKYKTISLFSGIGGFDLGFEYAGFDIIWANEIDKYSVQTFQKNVGDYIIQDDIRNVWDKIPNHDVLLAGFPCQPFSSLGKLKGFEDERGNLFFIIIDIIKKYDTKVVILENVANLLRHNKGNTINTIREIFQENGYTLHENVLNSADFGVPHRRKRAFLVAFKNSNFRQQKFHFPQGIQLNISTFDLLDDSVDERYFLTKKISETILSDGTKNFNSKFTINNKVAKTLTATMHKMHRASQDNYFEDDKNYRLFNNANRINIRKLTPNECRKLQGFPDNWVQVVSDTQAYKQFGNSVTVDVIYNLASKVMEYIDDNILPKTNLV